MLMKNGHQIKTVQKRIGHSSSVMTEDCYVLLTHKKVRDAANIGSTPTKRI